MLKAPRIRATRVAASELRFLSVLQWRPCMSWGFSVQAPMVSLKPFILPTPISEAQLHVALLLRKVVRAAQVKTETPKMACKCPPKVEPAVRCPFPVVRMSCHCFSKGGLTVSGPAQLLLLGQLQISWLSLHCAQVRLCRTWRRGQNGNEDRNKMGMIRRTKLICWNRGSGSNRKGPAVGGGAGEQKLAAAIAGLCRQGCAVTSVQTAYSFLL